jgi:hypothetical protein
MTKGGMRNYQDERVALRNPGPMVADLTHEDKHESSTPKQGCHSTMTLNLERLPGLAYIRALHRSCQP